MAQCSVPRREAAECVARSQKEQEETNARHDLLLMVSTHIGTVPDIVYAQRVDSIAQSSDAAATDSGSSDEVRSLRIAGPNPC
jgi:hypothetical protein